MILDKFNMVNMGGIDVVESQNTTVAGLYQRLVESIALCRYSTLYNWKFAGINIPPTPVELVHENGVITINEAISVDSNDVVRIQSLEPILEALSVSENGLYLPSEGYAGFSQVDVDVEISLGTKEITENGRYIASDDSLDGYSSVIVNVGSTDPMDGVTWESGSLGGNIAYSYQRLKSSSPIRIRSASMIILEVGATYLVTYDSNYKVGLDYFNGAGGYTGTYTGWIGSGNTITPEYPFAAISVGKISDASISPSDATETALTITKQ